MPQHDLHADRHADRQIFRAPERFADRAPSAPPERPLRVLVATAESATGEHTASILVQRGHAVVAMATDGAEALGRARRLAREVSLDVALVDVALPTLSGVEVAYGIAESAPHVAVVLTADTSPDDLPPVACALVNADASDVARTSAAALLPRRTDAAALDSTLRLAVAHAREIASARLEARQARELLDASKLIERAKGVLMRRTRCTPDEASGLLERAAAAEGQITLADVARAVLQSEPNYTPPRPRA